MSTPQVSHVFEGAEVIPSDGGVEVRSGPTAWANAATFAAPPTGGVDDAHVFVAARTVQGCAGFSLVAGDLATLLGDESRVPSGERAFVALPVPRGHEHVHVVVRNATAMDDVTVVELLGIASGAVPEVELRPDDVVRALREPETVHRNLVVRAWPELPAAEVSAWERVRSIPLRVSHTGPSTVPAPSEIFSDEIGRVVLQSVEDLRAAVARFDDRAVAEHIATACVQDAYLMMNTVRVVRLVEALQRRGGAMRRLVEVGAWFGSFALPLARLGYDVTAVDRYDSYGNAFETFTDLMRDSGVRIVSTTREDEDRALDGLGRFEIAFAGAVIEHIPHTPRGLLERLARSVQPSGLLAVDTPNLARYWNRRMLARGESVFQPIGEQFSCTPPWEGHHREYTASELAWMLEQVGCRHVETERFDYNLLQFDVLSAEHVEARCRFLEDPSMCDMLLAVGEVPPH